jgi:L-ascorbate metabolism protein UlaG (beta-lactamase superfamily)
MPQRKVPARELIHFIVKVRWHASQEGDEKRHLGQVRQIAHRMFQNYIGYNHRGEYRLKSRGERPFLESVAARKAYEERWGSAPAAERHLDVKFTGHSGFRLSGSRVVWIDPYLAGNRFAAMPLEAVTRADLVLITHDHPHHKVDGVAIAKRTGATLIGITGLVQPEKGLKFAPMNIGGRLEHDGVTVHMVPAIHAAGPLAAAGYIVEMDGYTIYHAGDTALFEDMKNFGHEHELDLALLPVGDRYTMGVRDAARATAYLRPRYVVPMHHGTDPSIEADLEEFRLLVGDGADVKLLKPGDTLTLDRVDRAATLPSA